MQPDAKPSPHTGTALGDALASIAAKDAEQSGAATNNDIPRAPAPVLTKAALYGPLGAYVGQVSQATEAAPAAILASAVAAAGVLVGRGPTWPIDGAPHHARFFVLLVGPSATGRKSTAMAHGARKLLELLDPDFLRARVNSGLSSGEGLIDAVRDPMPEREQANGKVVPADPGVPDKRLLVLEDELGGAFAKMSRDGNTLSAVLREAWDGRILRTMTRANKLIATDPHIGLIGCITPADLRQSLRATEVLNGLANRFLLVWTERVQMLPHGADAAIPGALLTLLRNAIDNARRVHVVRWTPPAAARWAAVYPALSTPTAGGALSALLARGAPQVRRLAMLYAALDGTSAVDVPHLNAALAFWAYVEASTRYVYQQADSLPPRAQRILAALEVAGDAGLDREAIRRVVGSNNIPAAEITNDLHALREAGVAYLRTEPTAGRPREVWVHGYFLGTKIGAPATEGEEWEHREQSEEGAPLISPSAHPSHTDHVGPGLDPMDWAALGAAA